MLTNWYNKRQWKIAVFSAFAPGVGQWSNGQTYKALAFLCIHSCAIVWLWTPLLMSGHLSSNQWLLAMGALSLWVLSVLDAYVYSSDCSMPFFNAATTVHTMQGVAFVILLSALTALNFAFPDPVVQGGKISFLIPAVSIAVAVVFDPITGGAIGLMAILLRLCFHPYASLAVIPRCLSILSACGLGALIGRKKYLFSGLSAVVPDAVDVLILSRQLGTTIFGLAIVERLIFHWVMVSGLVALLSLIKKWYFSHFLDFEAATLDSVVPIRETQHNTAPHVQALQYKPIIQSVPVYADANTKTLWHELLGIENMTRAWKRVFANHGAPGVDKVTVDDFSMNAAENISALCSLLDNGQYQPSQLKTFTIPKRSGSLRQLSIPTVRDRIVQQSLMQILVPIFERQFLDCSFAYRPGRSPHHALKRVDQHLRENGHWILDGDIESFFDTVDHSVLVY